MLNNTDRVIVPRHFYCPLITWHFKSDSSYMLAFVSCLISFYIDHIKFYYQIGFFCLENIKQTNSIILFQKHY